MEVLDEVIRSTVAIHGNAKQESLQKVVKPLALLNFATGPGGRALPTKKAIVSSLQAALRQNVPLSEEML